MFVFSFKTSKRQLIFFSGLFLCVLFFCTIFFNFNNYDSVCISANKNFNVKTTDNTSRVEFLSKFGWKVDNEPAEIHEVTIPQKFNDTYEKYNQIQKEQGFNLEKHKGQQCKRFTYKVLNYKNNPNGVNANLLVYKNKIIGGDISSVELSGFMHGFSKPDELINTFSNTKWQPSPGIEKSDCITQTTYRDSFNLDSYMLTAPID